VLVGDSIPTQVEVHLGESTQVGGSRKRKRKCVATNGGPVRLVLGEDITMAYVLDMSSKEMVGNA
jgi:hypothetical protein